jgi:Zinc dependent phospholipase C
MRILCLTIGLACCLVFVCVSASAYSVLTHEQVVDLAWEGDIQPMLLEKFPQSTPEDLRRAHAFAYGGSLVQDMGYYPFGKKYFSDLLHYVRTGDFVEALFQEAHDVNEYAFALGALAHYSSDNVGHPVVNKVVAMEFPNLREKHGDEVTYADDPKAHIRTEFGFDMVQVAKNRYTSDRYHDFIGFEVATPLLERAFQKTYGLSLDETLGGDEELAINSFRRAVSSFVPELTRVALLKRKKQLVRETPNFDRRKFLYRLSRSHFEKEWGKGYRRPGFRERVLAFLLHIIPKVGPASALAFKVPSTQAADMYIKSVNQTLDNYHSLLREVRRGKAELGNTDCDTGRATTPGEYSLTDKTYAHLLRDLSTKHYLQASPELRANVLAFYSDLNAPFYTKKNAKAWHGTELDLKRFTSQPSPGTSSLSPQ